MPLSRAASASGTPGGESPVFMNARTVPNNKAVQRARLKKLHLTLSPKGQRSEATSPESLSPSPMHAPLTPVTTETAKAPITATSSMPPLLPSLEHSPIVPSTTLTSSASAPKEHYSPLIAPLSITPKAVTPVLRSATIESKSPLPPIVSNNLDVSNSSTPIEPSTPRSLSPTPATAPVERNPRLQPTRLLSPRRSPRRLAVATIQSAEVEPLTPSQRQSSRSLSPSPLPILPSPETVSADSEPSQTAEIIQPITSNTPKPSARRSDASAVSLQLELPAKEEPRKSVLRGYDTDMPTQRPLGPNTEKPDQPPSQTQSMSEESKQSESVVDLTTAAASPNLEPSRTRVRTVTRIERLLSPRNTVDEATIDEDTPTDLVSPRRKRLSVDVNASMYASRIGDTVSELPTMVGRYNSLSVPPGGNGDYPLSPASQSDVINFIHQSNASINNSSQSQPPPLSFSRSLSRTSNSSAQSSYFQPAGSGGGMSQYSRQPTRVVMQPSQFMSSAAPYQMHQVYNSMQQPLMLPMSMSMMPQYVDAHAMMMSQQLYPSMPSMPINPYEPQYQNPYFNHPIHQQFPPVMGQSQPMMGQYGTMQMQTMLQPPSTGQSLPITAQSKRDLFLAIRNNRHSAVVELLQSGVPCDIVDRHYNQPLHYACQVGSKRLVKALLRAGADLNAVNIQGQTPLHFCFAYHFDPLAAYLISKGADDQKLNYFGRTCYEGLRPESAEEAAQLLTENQSLIPKHIPMEKVLASLQASA